MNILPRNGRFYKSIVLPSLIGSARSRKVGSSGYWRAGSAQKKDMHHSRKTYMIAGTTHVIRFACLILVALLLPTAGEAPVNAQESDFLRDAFDGKPNQKKTPDQVPEKEAEEKPPEPTPEEIEAKKKLEATQRALEKVKQEKIQAQQRLEARRKALENVRGREQSVAKDVKVIENERAKLNSQLIETARRIRESESILLQTEDRLLDLTKQEGDVRRSINERHDTVAKLLGAMQRIGRQPPPPLVTQRDDALKMVRSAMLLASILPELETQAARLTRDLEDLVDLQERTRIEQIRVKEESGKLALEQKRVDGLLAEKKARLGERQVQLASIQQAAKQYANNLTELNAFLSRMDKEIDKTVKAVDRGESKLLRARQRAAEARRKAEEAKRKAEEAERKAEEARQRAIEEKRLAAIREVEAQKRAELKAAEEQRIAELKAAEAKKQAELQAVEAARLAVLEAEQRKKLGDKPVVELKPTKRLALASPGRMKPSVSFRKARGTVPLPVSGRALTKFASDDGFGGKTKGMELQTRGNSQVTSPMDGWIVYSGPFRSYGQLLIINAGEGYHVLLAGMNQIDVSLGQFVLKGEPIGIMGTSVADGKEDEPKRPVLYVEFRKDGRPIDPDPWWAEGPKKVQG